MYGKVCARTHVEKNEFKLTFNSLSAAVYWTTVLKHLQTRNQWDGVLSVLFKQTSVRARAHWPCDVNALYSSSRGEGGRRGGGREAAVQCKPSHWWREAVNMRSQSAPHFLKMGQFVSPAWIKTPCSLGLWWGAAALTTGHTSINCFFFFFFLLCRRPGHWAARKLWAYPLTPCRKCQPNDY